MRRKDNAAGGIGGAASGPIPIVDTPIIHNPSPGIRGLELEIAALSIDELIEQEMLLADLPPEFHNAARCRLLLVREALEARMAVWP